MIESIKKFNELKLQLESLKKEIDQEAVSYYFSHDNLSIKECAKIFGFSEKKMSHLLRETNIKNYLRFNYRGNKKYSIDETFFDVIDTEEKAYWLGFMTADGCIFKDRPQLRLALSEKDYDHVVKFKHALKSEHNVVKTPAGGFKRKDGTHIMAASISIQNRRLYNRLKELGFTSVKSGHEKPIDLSPHLIRHYIRGLFDGDGWISYSEKHRDLGFGMGEEILLYIKECFEKYAKIKNSYKVLYFKTSYRYRISSKKEMLKALDYMYKDSNIYLERKYNKYLEFKNAVLGQQAQKTKDDYGGIKLENPH